MLILILRILAVSGMYKVFEKAKMNEPWHALVPGLNVWSFSKIGNTPTIFAILGVFFYIFIVVRGFYPNEVNTFAHSNFVIFEIFLLSTLVGYCRVLYDVAKSFGKGFLFSLGLIFLSFIFFPILGFGDAVYASKNQDKEILVSPIV
jgi:hypothetical protein